MNEEIDKILEEAKQVSKKINLTLEEWQSELLTVEDNKYNRKEEKIEIINEFK